MFERGKRDEGPGERADFASAPPQRSQAPATPKPSQNGECAVIGRSIQINGDVRGDEDLRIEGDISGTVQLKNSNLTIGTEGKVRADVYARSITVYGTTEGDLYATERVNVHINAQVRGNITAPKVGIEEGAKFKGSIEMDQDAVDQALGKANMQGAASQSNKAPDNKGAAPKAVKEASLSRPTGAG
ncbi:MAG TPA: polymer-forming cytoskeletal protein [Woeseiaceae bacterium]|nr:polymer-forming cytoskeletal protein [Woeseiaceae bacterium]